MDASSTALITFSFSGTLQVQNYQVMIPDDFIQGHGAGTGPANVFNLIGTGTVSNPQFVIQSLSRTLYNTAGQMTESDSYAIINNNTYLATTPNDPYSGTPITNQLSGLDPNGNYYATTYAYDIDGRQYQTIDANGNVHNYMFDALGRQISDTVTTLGTNVDGSVLRIDTAYNNQGLAYLLTSYADTGGTTIVNQVKNIYNPGAAAHTRPIGGTGFRGDEGGLPLCRCTASLNGGQLVQQYQATASPRKVRGEHVGPDWPLSRTALGLRDIGISASMP